MPVSLLGCGDFTPFGLWATDDTLKKSLIKQPFAGMSTFAVRRLNVGGSLSTNVLRGIFTFKSFEHFYED